MTSNDGTLILPGGPSYSSSVRLPEPTWITKGLVAYVLLVGILILAGGPAARFGIPVVSTGVAYFLYRRSPVTYISFVWWMWFMVALVRRLSDLRSGYTEGNPILVVPYIAALVCFPTLFNRPDVWKRRSCLPFSLAFASALYGLGVGLLGVPIKFLAVDSLGWFCPLVFGFFLYAELEDSDRKQEHLAGLEKTFCWGLLIMGVYGVLQYVFAPAWDVLWMQESPIGSIGTPEPFAIRVFSTMNAPGSLGYALMPGLLLLMRRKGLLVILASVAGYAALLLSSVRAAWAAFLLGVVVLALRERKYAARLGLAVALVTVCLLGASAIDEVRDNIQSRLKTFTELQDDTSYQDRQQGSAAMLLNVAENPLGGGLGVIESEYAGKTALGTRDSGIWETLLSLGWLGGAVYFASLLLLAWNGWRGGANSTSDEVVANCICVGMIAVIFLGDVTLGSSGCAVWMFGALAMPTPAASTFPPEVADGN